MLEKSRARMRERYSAARQRETNFLMSFDLPRLNRRLLILLGVLIALNFLDVVTTLVALNAGPPFVERNPIASNLFSHDFPGFVAALGLKYVPLLPLVYAASVPLTTKRVLALRVVKVSSFIALVAADMFYAGVVGSNSLNLARYYFGF